MLQTHVSKYLSLTAEEKKTLAEEKAKEIEEQNKVIAIEKKDAESSLKEALPALEAARIALQGLDKSDVTEIRYSLPLIQSILFILSLKYLVMMAKFISMN